MKSRSKELLLLKEMKSYLLFYQQVILSLEDDVEGILFTLMQCLYTFIIVSVLESSPVDMIGMCISIYDCMVFIYFLYICPF